MSLLKGVIARFRKMRPSVEREPQRGVPPPHGSGASVNLTQEQFRQLMIAALEDSPRARAIVRQAFLPSLPVRGGTCAGPSAADITHGDFGSNCSDTGDYTFSGGGKVGVGTSSPSYALDVNSNVIAVGKATSGLGGAVRIRGDSGTMLWLVGVLGSTGAVNFVVSDLVNHHQPFVIEPGAPQDQVHLTSDGSVVLGGTASKQSSGGPEMISFQDTDADGVAFAGFVGSETQFRFGASLKGFMEWGPGTANQDVAFFRNWAGGLAVQSFNGTTSDHAFAVQRPTTGSPAPVGSDLFRVSTETGRITEAVGEVALKAHGDNSSWSKSDAFVTTAAVQTINTTSAVTLATLATETSRAYQVLVRVVARQSTGANHALLFRTALVVNEGGTVTYSAADVISPLPSGTTWAVTFHVSGTNLQIQVATPSDSSITVNWVATIEYQSVGTNS
jgi:hypothetical protein